MRKLGEIDVYHLKEALLDEAQKLALRSHVGGEPIQKIENYTTAAIVLKSLANVFDGLQGASEC